MDDPRAVIGIIGLIICAFWAGWLSSNNWRKRKEPKCLVPYVVGMCIETGTDPNDPTFIRLLIESNEQQLRDGPPLVYRYVRITPTDEGYE